MDDKVNFFARNFKRVIRCQKITFGILFLSSNFYYASAEYVKSLEIDGTYKGHLKIGNGEIYVNIEGLNLAQLPRINSTENKAFAHLYIDTNTSIKGPEYDCRIYQDAAVLYASSKPGYFNIFVDALNVDQDQGYATLSINQDSIGSSISRIWTHHISALNSELRNIILPGNHTLDEAINAYGKPTGEMGSGNTKIYIFNAAGYTITEIFNKNLRCTQSDRKPQKQVASRNSYKASIARKPTYYRAPAPSRPKQLTPQETYPVQVLGMWLFKDLPNRKRAPNGKMFCVLEIEVRNNSGRTFTVNPWNFHVISKEDYASQGKWCYHSFQPQELPPNTRTFGTVVFEVQIGNNYKMPELDRMTFEYANSRYIDALLPTKHNVKHLK